MLFSLSEIFGGTGFQPVRAQAKACGYHFSRSQAVLGNALPAKLSLATIFVPKCNLGTRGKSLQSIGSQAQLGNQKKDKAVFYALVLTTVLCCISFDFIYAF
jgi:hypothetical protein